MASESEDTISRSSAEPRKSSGRAPSMNLRYTGTRIPGRGFDGGIGKSSIYKDDVQRELTLQEVVDILTNPDLSRLSTMPPVRPRGGTMYLYRCPDYETRHDLRADQYLWCQQGTKKMPKDDPVIKRFFMYLRTEEPVKNISKRPKKTFAKYDVRFKKYEYELINAEDPLVLVHYVGDESVWRPFRDRRDEYTGGQYMWLPRNTSDFDADDTRQSDVYETTVAGTPGSLGAYEGLQGTQQREQAPTYTKTRRQTRISNGGDVSPSKRPRLVEEYNETVAATQSIEPSGTGTGYESSTGGGRHSADLDTDFGAPPRLEVEPMLGKDVAVMAKFNSIYPAFEFCENVRMQGFVQALSIVPQVAVVAASKPLLTVANDLAQLKSIKKTDRFEFYYVSAGPVASGYYLSTLLFRHCLFDSEPVIPVAYLIHERRNPNDHRRLFELIKEKCPDVASSECVFITDREFGSISTVIPKAIQLYSWHYIEDDVANWVESNGGASEEANGYLNDVQSLMKAKDVENFNRELALKRRQWPSGFATFFDTYLKNDILSKGGRWRSDKLSGGVYDPFCGVVIPACNYLNDLVGDLIAWPEISQSEYYVREIERSMHQVGSFKLFTQFHHYARPSRRLRNFADLAITDPREIVNYVRDLST